MTRAPLFERWMLALLVWILAAAGTSTLASRAAAATDEPTTGKTLPTATAPADVASADAASLTDDTSANHRPTLFIAGDSTAAPGKGEEQRGWGLPLADYLDPEKMAVANHARGGRSSRTFLTEGHWDRLLQDVKTGDTVLIQFGHNDGSALNEGRARGSLPGLGDETQEIQNILTKQPETVHTFGWYIRKFISDVKAKGATPIVVSLTVRNIWNDGRIERGSGPYSRWLFDLARSAAVPFLDLTNTAADQLEAMGEAKVKALYPQDHTHFNAEAADLFARAVIAGLKGLRPSPVEGRLSEKGEAVPADKFSWLRLPRAVNPALPSIVLVGDSTVRNGRGDGVNGEWGWGDFLEEHINTAKANVVNRAVGGTGVKSFTALGHWANALALVNPGDVVVIQFGHNDNGPKAPLKGIGEETEERENPETKQVQTEHTWGWHLRRYIADVRAKGATPIVCSLVPRKVWEGDRIARAKDSHADWARAVAKAQGVAFVDLHEIIAQRYEKLGAAAVQPLFADERVHTSKEGARLNAACFVEGVKALAENPLQPYLKGSN